jgi:hypothetical protein
MIKPQITPVEIELIQKLISSNPTLSRTRLSVELCRIWDWRYPDGQPKEISCRDLLRQLDAEGLVVLPPCKQRPVMKRGHITWIPEPLYLCWTVHTETGIEVPLFLRDFAYFWFTSWFIKPFDNIQFIQ